jgi:hypothetical protein
MRPLLAESSEPAHDRGCRRDPLIAEVNASIPITQPTSAVAQTVQCRMIAEALSRSGIDQRGVAEALHWVAWATQRCGV